MRFLALVALLVLLALLAPGSLHAQVQACPPSDLSGASWGQWRGGMFFDSDTPSVLILVNHRSNERVLRYAASEASSPHFQVFTSSRSSPRDQRVGVEITLCGPGGLIKDRIEFTVDGDRLLFTPDSEFGKSFTAWLKERGAKDDDVEDLIPGVRVAFMRTQSEGVTRYMVTTSWYLGRRSLFFIRQLP